MPKKNKLNNWNTVSDDEELPFDGSETLNESLNEQSIDDEDWIDEIEEESIFDNPYRIYQYLTKKIVKQNLACMQAAIFLFNHVNHRKRNMLMIGPTGSGKTYIWECLKELYEWIVIVNAAEITPAGIKGESVSSILYNLVGCDEEDDGPAYILVLDEFDKCVIKGNSTDVCMSVQHEFLALISPSHQYIRLHPSQDHPDVNSRLAIGNFSWVFLGAFDSLVFSMINQKNAIGFGNESIKNYNNAYEKEITMQDLIEYGLIREFAGRINMIVCLKPLDEAAFLEAIRSEEGLIDQLHREYLINADFIRENILKDEKLDEIAKEAYEKKLGVRYVKNRMIEVMDNHIFTNYKKYEEESDGS